MIQDRPITSLYEVHTAANGQIRKNTAYFSKDDTDRQIASSGTTPSEFCAPGQCRADHLPEVGSAFEKVTATSSLEALAFEEISATLPSRSDPQTQVVTDPSLIALAMVIGPVTLVTIVALVFGRDFSLAAALDPIGSMKFKATGKARDAEEK